MGGARARFGVCECTTMELPNLGEFKALLQDDRIFRDYLNAFLNLPVFSKRLTYNKERKYFNIDPPLRSSNLVLDEPSVISWVHSCRLPLFWGSDLHFECRLCCELLRDNEELQSAFASVSEMHQFRRFLFHSEGESACLFWLDVERLKHTQDPWIAEKLVLRIQQLYLRDGGHFSLGDKLKEKILYLYCHEGNLLPSQRAGNLAGAQSIVLHSLRSYWCKRYVIHLDTLNASGKLSHTVSSIAQSEDICRKHATTLHLPHIITDEGNSGADAQVKQVSHIKLKSCTLPLINSCTSTSGSASSERFLQSFGSKNKKGPLSLLITPSTQALFPQSIASTYQHRSQRLHHLHPYLYASLRADFIAGNPLLRYFASLQSEGLKALDHLLFWQSVENILTLDEMKRWYKRNKCAESTCPYLSYFEIYPVSLNLQELLQLFIRKTAHHRINLPEQVRKELSLLLPKGLGQSLLLSAQDYAAEYLLKPWQQFLLHDHELFVKSCTSARFQRRLSSSSQHHMSAEQFLAEQTYSSSNLGCMWTALQFAEATKYPGICQLPSRRLTGVSLMKSATDSEEDDGLSEGYSDLAVDPIDLPGIALNPMVTTVYSMVRWDPHRSRHKVLYASRPAHSCDQHKKPPLPRSFTEVLKDPVQLEFFHHFLLSQGGNAEMQLLLWLSVEDMKTSMGNRRACNFKMRNILKRFFTSNADRVLKCHDPIIYELSQKERASPFQLLAAQAAVAEAMERHWYQDYLAFLSTEEKEEEESSDDQTAKKPIICKDRTKGLWGMFAHNVISFRHGLMNTSTSEMFQNFLKEEVIKGNTSGHRKVIGTKVVTVTKLLNDLSFWAEVERYKDLADIVNAAKANGTHTPEDDIMVHKKAHAIVNCYIDSAVSPRVQINIPNELVQLILDNLSQGYIFRGLFHEAALSIFSVLILYWKRFCMARFAPKRKWSVGSSNSHPNQPSARCVSLGSAGNTNLKMKSFPSFSVFEKRGSQIFDVGPILSFSLSAGLHWIRVDRPDY